MTLLERLKELAKAATPGPWEISEVHPWVVIAPETPARRGSGHIYVSCGGGNNEENAVFLALALNALPDLLAVVEAAVEYVENPYTWNLQDIKAALAKLTEDAHED